MPTTRAEAERINQIVNRYIDSELMCSLISDLFDDVGLSTKNYSLRRSLLMLRQLYEPSYQVPVEDVKRLAMEYASDVTLQDVTVDGYIGISSHEYLDFVAGTYPNCEHTLSDSSG